MTKTITIDIDGNAHRLDLHRLLASAHEYGWRIQRRAGAWIVSLADHPFDSEGVAYASRGGAERAVAEGHIEELHVWGHDIDARCGPLTA
jgi:hypothetical protein